MNVGESNARWAQELRLVCCEVRPQFGIRGFAIPCALREQQTHSFEQASADHDVAAFHTQSIRFLENLGIGIVVVWVKKTEVLDQSTLNDGVAAIPSETARYANQ